MILYRVVRGAIQVIIRIYWRVSFSGLDNVPAVGSYVLAPVHRSFIDFALVSGVTRRRLRYMGKEELWKNKLLGRFISALGAFPVRRGAADREALRRCLDVVASGEPLVLFPEGTRRSGPAVTDLHEGAAYVAVRAGVPIVPVGIGGSERALQKGKRLPRPVKVRVVVGPAIQPAPASAPGGGSNGGRVTPRRAVHAVTEQLQAEIQRLFDEAQKAAGAG